MMSSYNCLLLISFFSLTFSTSCMDNENTNYFIPTNSDNSSDIKSSTPPQSPNTILHSNTVTEKSLNTNQNSGSSWLSNFGYGTKRYLVGTSIRQIVRDKHANGILQQDFQNGIVSATRDYEDAISLGYTSRNLLNPENQKKINELFNIGKEIKDKDGQTLSISKVLAGKYKELQAQALVTIVTQHAISQKEAEISRDTKINIAQNECSIKINAANTEYNELIEKQRNDGFIAASNYRHLYKQSQDKTGIIAIANRNNFRDMQTYEQYLKTIETNNK